MSKKQSKHSQKCLKILKNFEKHAKNRKKVEKP